MKKKSTSLFIIFSLLILFSFQQCGSNDTGEKSEKIEIKTPEAGDLVSTLQNELADSVINAFNSVIKNANNDPLTIMSLGHYAYLNRELETATWLYALSKDQKPEDVNNLSNLALCLHELSVMNPSKKDFLQKAISMLEKAGGLEPANAAVQNNLGYAYFQQYLNSNDSSLLVKAEDAFNRAIALDPNNSVFYSHLADVKKAQKKNKEAISNLNKAFKLNPYDGIFINSTNGFTEFASATSSRSYCDSINFYCMKNCPPSIIGRIKVVTCEMAQQDARFDCAAGRPYAISYNCDDEIPATGFMIPGLQSGVGIITPWGKIAFLIQGGGNIDVEAVISTPVPGIEFSGSGRYNPASGMSVTDFGGQLSLNLYDKGLVAPVLNKFNIRPAGLKVNIGTNEKNNGIELEAYETPIVHIH